VDVQEARQGTRAQEKVQESEKEGPGDSLREPGVRHTLPADAGRARSRVVPTPRCHPSTPPPAAAAAAAGAQRMPSPCTGH
jgi:hypothetical protein